jgi:phospholipase/carboxylesterase
MHRRAALQHFITLVGGMLPLCGCYTRTVSTPDVGGLFLPVPTLMPTVLMPAHPKPQPELAVIALHGYGGEPNSLLEKIATILPPGCMMLAPRGSYATVGGYSWFILTRDRELLAKSDAIAVEQMQYLIQFVKDTYAPQRIVLFGHSQGAALAYLAAAQMKGDVSGLILFAAQDIELALDRTSRRMLCDMPVFLAHGQDDPIFPFASARKSRDLLIQAGAHVQFETFHGQHEIAENALVRARKWLTEPHERQPSHCD